MKKFVKFAVAMAATSLSLATAPSFATEEGKLLVWFMPDKAYNGMQKIGDKFSKETGVPVVVEHPDDAPGKFQQGAAAGKGPDIFLWAHDRMGEWAESGLLTPVEPSPDLRNSVLSIGWEAFTFNSKTWGYPISVEAVGLIYNKKFVKEAPKSFDDVIALSKTLKEQKVAAILWDYNNTYFTWPMLAANGGYVFGGKTGQLNIDDVGVNNEGAIIGANMLKKLIDEGVMPKGVGYAEMDAGFNREEVAMMINGPWAWKNIQASEIDFGVAPIPTINGKASRPFVGVLGLMVSRASKNKELAREFIENYVMNVEGMKMLDDDVKLGTPAHKDFFKQLSGDPNIQATMKNVELGLPMPNVPQMGKYWAAMGPALENITNGRQQVKEALDAAAARIKGGESSDEE
jgi:maltose/maltodextrin transport system substrate-binding protein